MPAARNRTILTLLPHTEPTTSPHPSHVTLDDAPARLLSKRVDVIVVDAELPFPDEALRRLIVVEDVDAALAACAPTR